MEETLNMGAAPQPASVVPELATAPATQTSAAPAQETVNAGSVSTEGIGGNTQGQYVLRVDENGKRTFTYEAPTVTDAAEPKKEPAEQTAVEQPAAPTENQQPAPGDNSSPGNATVTEQVSAAYNNVDPNAVPEYNLQEFSTALATNTIDERRVPEQFRQKYIDYSIQKAQQDYDAYVAQQAHQQQLIEQQLNQKPDPAKQQEFYAKLNEESRARALADLGITAEDYKAKEFEDEAMVERFEAARDWHRSKLINELQSRARSEETVRTQQANILNEIRAYVAEQKAKEPHFDEIDRMMGTLYQELPYNKAQRIAEAITAMRRNVIRPEQVGTLKEYYEIGRQMFYAKRNGLSANRAQAVAQSAARPQPPVVEAPGTGRTPTQVPGVSVEDMRKAANARERNNILYQLLQTKMKR